MTSQPSPPDPAPAAAATALSDAAQLAAAAWDQLMDPASHNQAVTQLCLVVRDLGTAAQGLARYHVTPAPPHSLSREFARHATTSAAWLLGASHSPGNVPAGTLRQFPVPGEHGAALRLAAREAITAWRQPSGTIADRDATVSQLITALAFLSEATLSLATNAPRHRILDHLYAVGIGLAEARVSLADAIRIPAGQAAPQRGPQAAPRPGEPR